MDAPFPAILQLVALLGLLTLGSVLGWLGFTGLRWYTYQRHKHAGYKPLWSEILADLLGELGSMGILAWWHLRAWSRDGLRPPEGPPSGPPVLCVHGITQNGSNLWGIRRALERRGRATRAVSLGTFRRKLESYVPPLRAALAELIAATPEGRVDVVAHSMGGVVLRLTLAQHPELAAHVRNVVTLGTPHAGSAATRGLPLGEAVRGLGRRSTILQDLGGLPSDAMVTTIAAEHDFLVYPIQTCHVPGGRAIELHGIGHNGLLTRRIAIEAVVEAICGE